MPFLQQGQDATVVIPAGQSIRVGAFIGATATLTIPNSFRGGPVTVVTDTQQVIGPMPKTVTINVLATKGATEYVVAATPVLTDIPYGGLNGAVTASTLSNSSTRTTTAAARAVNTTAALAAVTIAASINSTYLATPAAAITVTVAAPVGDGERRRIVFGAATTVTWVPTAPATSVLAQTAFIAGEAIELVYNSVAGTPTNSAATTWYSY